MRYAIAHIADIHFRKKEPEGALSVFTELIKDLKKQKDVLSEYELFLAITGDIVYEGKDSESYSCFQDEFNQRLNDIGITKDYRMIVPGNHDVDRRFFEIDFDSYHDSILKNSDTEPKFNNFVCDKNCNDEIFSNYHLFEDDFAKYGLGFCSEGKGWKISNEIGVYCLNSSLCSFGGYNETQDKGNLGIYTRGLTEWCNCIDTSINILLMHHPLTNLINWSKNALKQTLEKHFSLCLCGHSHEQDVFYNKISQKSLICSAPQVFTKKDDLLGYGIILIDDNAINKIMYREYINGKFLNGQRFSSNTEGIVSIPNKYFKSLEIIKNSLNNSLSFFKGQPVVFIEPKISKEREFNDGPNLLDELIKDPGPSIITSHPQFGLTCLSHYMRLEAFKLNNFWVYLDSKRIKARNVKSEIDSQLKVFEKDADEIKCIILDSWDSTIMDHINILKLIDNEYRDVPIIIMANYTGFQLNFNFDFSKLNSEFQILHLQAMQRHKVREFVSRYNQEKNIEKEDVLVTKVVKDLEALNIHRTPFNCLTLLKALEREFNEDLVNRTNMIKAVLFILFTDADSFTYSTDKPDVNDACYVLGRFCKQLLEKRIRSFSKVDFLSDMESFCKEHFVSLDIETVLNILESNNIILRFNEYLEFKHSYWIYYFAAIYMQYDEEFRDYILKDKNYVNYPEIIDFYTGIDGRGDAAIEVLLADLNNLVTTVENNIGIVGDFNPFEQVIWNPSEHAIEMIRKDISEKVKESNLPTVIKDQHADEKYNSEAPYDQSISEFLNKYSVISLLQNIKASSRALRNSKWVNAKLRQDMMRAVLNGWEQISKVLFCLSPTLAQKGSALYDGLYVFVLENTESSYEKRLENILIANPTNVVDHFKDDLSSKKIGPLIFDAVENSTHIQKHFISIFLIKERPSGWYKVLFDFMNLLHRNSFFLGNLYNTIKDEVKKGFVPDDELNDLKILMSVVAAKIDYARKAKITTIPRNMVINKKNMLPVDKILAKAKKPNNMP